MDDRFSRTCMLMGEDALEKLARSRIAVFGVGGVGGYVVEALARSGAGHIDIVDNDTVCLSNLNRQIIATESTIGKYKVEAARERILDINPGIEVTVHKCFFLPDNRADIDFADYDYIIDAVDTVTAKLAIISEAKARGIPVISAMGCGNRLDPGKLTVADIYETKGDPLSRIMRKELKKRGIESLKVVYSIEKPIKPERTDADIPDDKNDVLQVISPGDGNDTGDPAEKLEKNKTSKRKRDIPGSAIFVPAAAGLIIASEVCRELAGIE